MKTNVNRNFDRKNFTALYEIIAENGNTALKPLAPLPARPPLYLVPKTESAAVQAPARPAFLGKYILGFVAAACLLSLVSGNGALVGDLLGCGSVAYFAIRCLTEDGKEA